MKAREFIIRMEQLIDATGDFDLPPLFNDSFTDMISLYRRNQVVFKKREAFSFDEPQSDEEED